MKTENQLGTKVGLGIVQFMPIESFQNPDWGKAQIEAFADFSPDGEVRQQSVGDWPRVNEAILHPDGMFAIEASAPSFTTSLRFCPEKRDAGDFEIRRKHGKVERGRTTDVTSVPADSTDYRVSMLTSFPTRYVVSTVDSERPYSLRVWLVGLREFRVVDKTDEANEGTGS